MDTDEIEEALENLEARKKSLAKARAALTRFELTLAFCERMMREHSVDKLKDLPPSVRETIDKMMPMPSKRPEIDVEAAMEAIWERLYPGTPERPN